MIASLSSCKGRTGVKGTCDDGIAHELCPSSIRNEMIFYIAPIPLSVHMNLSLSWCESNANGQYKL